MIKHIIAILLFFVTASVFSQKKITMKKENGVYTLPCKVNGINMKFIFDTGASNVTISLTEAKFLIKQGLLSEKDFITKQDYEIADGNIIEGTIINIKTIEIDGLILHNVEASIIHNQNAPLLLGQTALSKLGVISIDGNILTIENAKTTDIIEFEKTFNLFKNDINSMIFKDSIVEISYTVDFGIYNDFSYAIVGVEKIIKTSEEETSKVFIIPFNKIGKMKISHLNNEKTNSNITAITLNSKADGTFLVMENEKKEEENSFVFFLNSDIAGEKIITNIKSLMKINQEIINQKIDSLYKEDIEETFDWIKEKISLWEFSGIGIDFDYSIDLIKQKNGGFALKGILNQKIKNEKHTFFVPLNKMINIRFKKIETGNQSENMTVMIFTAENDEMAYKYDGKKTTAFPIMLNSNMENDDMENRFFKAFQNLITINDKIIKEKDIVEKF